MATIKHNKIKHNKKILCVCRWGNIRSVAMARFFKKEGYEALACGTKACTPETLEMLCNWADLIFVAKEDMIQYLPEGHAEKIIDTQIGEDIWLDADHPDLMVKVKRMYYANKARLFELRSYGKD